MANLKYSRQRESIKEFLADRYDHPTADVVYENIKLVYPNISLGTVYRNLGLLSDLGEIRKITAGDGKEHYDGNTRPHNHFICHKCGRVIDMPTHIPDYTPEISKEDFSGQIEGHTVFFYGTCDCCLN